MTATHRRKKPAPLVPPMFIPGQPVSVNAMYGPRKRAHAKRLSEEAIAWHDAIAFSTMRYRLPQSAPRPQLAVSFVVVGIRGDADNYAKIICDGLKDGLMVDDRYFVRVTCEKRRASRPFERGAWIEVEQLADERVAH